MEEKKIIYAKGAKYQQANIYFFNTSQLKKNKTDF